MYRTNDTNKLATKWADGYEVVEVLEFDSYQVAGH